MFKLIKCYVTTKILCELLHFVTTSDLLAGRKKLSGKLGTVLESVGINSFLADLEKNLISCQNRI